MPPRLAYPPAPGQARPRARGLMCGRRVPAKPAPGSSPCTYPAPTLHLAPRGGLCWLGLPRRPPRGHRAPTPPPTLHLGTWGPPPHRLLTRHLPCTARPTYSPWPALFADLSRASRPLPPAPTKARGRVPPAPPGLLPCTPSPWCARRGLRGPGQPHFSVSSLSLSDAPVRPAAFVGASSRWEI